MSNVISDSAIAGVASEAGFIGLGLRVAVAVALAESSGDAEVVNSIGATGLWQIYIKAHPEYTTADMKDPRKNAAAAFKISSGGVNWRPWTTFTSGSYKKFNARADAAIKTVPAKNELDKLLRGGAGKALASTGETAEDAVGKLDPQAGIAGLTETLRQSSLTFMVVLLALVLLILGVVIISRRQVASGVGGAAVGLLPGGGAIKAVAKVVK